jgi:hypothetical protein
MGRFLLIRGPVLRIGKTSERVPKNENPRFRRNLPRNEHGWTMRNPNLQRNPEGSHLLSSKPEEGEVPG